MKRRGQVTVYYAGETPNTDPSNNTHIESQSIYIYVYFFISLVNTLHELMVAVAKYQLTGFESCTQPFSLDIALARCFSELTGFEVLHSTLLPRYSASPLFLRADRV